MFDIVSMGEALFDMMPIGLSDEDKVTFHAVPGGATLNCMSQLSHLGFKTSYISAVGEDSFGKILKQAVAKERLTRRVFNRRKRPTRHLPLSIMMTRAIAVFLSTEIPGGYDDYVW